ncbi:G2/M phase-specific E3 ubiquitin-protein ligase-like [Asterias amurensis]|uniref:G2/M phase-specific E3 ubiquitin-protein ligase-like n=1 Tax=Asterias amurensis TaxID=7602 RepID=UPI003AB3F4DD
MDLIIRACDDDTLKNVVSRRHIADLLRECGVFISPVRVSLDQREAIVGAVALHHAIVGVHAELAQFQHGLTLYGIMDLLKKDLKRGQTVMCPGRQPPSAEDFLTSMAQPEYALAGSNRKEREVDVYMFFTQFLEELNSEDSVKCGQHDLPTSFADFLFFMTGSRKPPVTGWPAKPQVIFKHDCFIQLLTMDNQDCHCFPVASTCSLKLTLPMHYVNYNAFRDSICVAIHAAKGFGQV